MDIFEEPEDRSNGTPKKETQTPKSSKLCSWRALTVLSLLLNVGYHRPWRWFWQSWGCRCVRRCRRGRSAGRCTSPADGGREQSAASPPTSAGCPSHAKSSSTNSEHIFIQVCIDLPWMTAFDAACSWGLARCGRHAYPGLFTDTSSEHLRFYFSVLFPAF